MAEEHPYRVARIEGAVARAFQRAPQEFTSVTDAAEADKALGDPENAHHCPLCNNFFGSEAFKRHAPTCIKAYAPGWERQRDREPPYSKVKQFRGRLFGPPRRV
jgi:hypothetical protein